jgi:hypothetical protein
MKIILTLALAMITGKIMMATAMTKPVSMVKRREIQRKNSKPVVTKILMPKNIFSVQPMQQIS